MSQREALFSSYAILNHLPDSNPIFFSLQAPLYFSLYTFFPFSLPVPSFLTFSAPCQISCPSQSLMPSCYLWPPPTCSGLQLEHLHPSPCVSPTMYLSWRTLCWLPVLEWVTCTGNSLQPELRECTTSREPLYCSSTSFCRAHKRGVLRWIPASVISVSKL